MRILILASYGPSLVNFRGQLIEALVVSGDDVVAASPDLDAGLIDELRRLGATPHQVKLSRNGLDPIADLRYGWQIYRLIRRTRSDLVFSYTAKPNIWGGIAAAIARVPSVAMVTGLGAAFTETGSRPKLRQRIGFAIARLLYRLSTRFNRLVIFQNSDDQADFIAAGCLRDHEKAMLVDGSGVDTSYFVEAASPREPVFLMVARLLGNKGIREFAEAAREVRARYPDARFRLVGPFDPGVDGIDPKLVDAWVADGVIDYRGSAADVRPYIAEAMVYVLPSYREGTPRSVLEAMAMGRPVITTDVPGCRDTIRNGIEGFLVPPRDSGALAVAIQRFLAEPELAEEFGRNARKRAVEKYDVERINCKMLEFLKR